jgi:hypothetical protein
MQIGELFQQVPIRSFAILNAAFHGAKLALAYVEIILRFVASMKKRFLLRFKLSNCFGLFPGILLPFRFDRFYPFFDSGNSKRDFFLLLLQLFQRNDLIAQLGEIGRLRSSFAPEVDFTFLEQSSLVTKRDASPLTPDLQTDFAEPCADEAHFS